MTLFLKKGFDAVTVDEIAAAADVSKRSFFDYFPTKEEVVSSWHDEFGAALAGAVRARPAEEPLVVVVEEALVTSISAAATPRAIALDRLVRETPALAARESLKYARLEATLAEALLERARSTTAQFHARLLAMVVIGSLRLGSADPQARAEADAGALGSYSKKVFRQVWTVLRDLGTEGLAQRRTRR